MINYYNYPKFQYQNESAAATNQAVGVPEKPDSAMGVTKNLTCFG